MSDKRAFKNDVYGQLARITKALASPKRIEMLDLLCQRPWTVDELAGELQLSMANASQHLRTMHAAQLVVATKKGLYVEYSVASDDVCSMVHSIRRLAEAQLSEIERITRRFAAGRDEFDSIDRDTLMNRIQEGSALLLDVRPEIEYRSGHLGGALSIPVDHLAERLQELPQDQQIVAYCRGPYCLFATDAVRLLRERGFDAVRYEEGVIDWKVAGLPVEVSSEQEPSDTSSSPASTTTARRSVPRSSTNGKSAGRKKP